MWKSSLFSWSRIQIVLCLLNFSISYCANICKIFPNELVSVFFSPPPCQVFDGEYFVYGDVLWADAAFHGGHCRDEAHHLVNIPRVPASTSGAGHVLVSAKAREAAHGAQVCLCVVLCWRCPSPQYGVGCEGLSCIPKVLPIGFQHSHIFWPPQCPQVSPLQVG